MPLAAFYRRYNEACNSHDFARLGEFVAEDVEVNGERRGLAGYVAGLEEVVRAFPDFHWDLRHLAVDEPWIAAHLLDTGTDTTGRSVTTQEFAFYRVQDEQIHESWGDLRLELLRG